MKNSFAMLLLLWLSMSSAPALAESEHLSAALVDIAGKRICDRLQNRYRGLKRDLPGGATAYSGTLWIHSCEVEYNEKQQDIITLLLGIEGWRWLDREKEKLGAEFKVSEFAQFQVDISLQGRVAAKYDPQAKRLAMWLKPTETPEVNFKASGDVDVEKEGMWGAVLAGAASIIGQSPDTLADETIAEKGEKRFKEKISEGFSVSIDFCSGRVVSELGQLKQAALFTKLDKNQRAIFKKVSLNPSSFLLFGPYGEKSKLLDLQLRMEDPANFQNKLICLDDAIRLTKTYMEGDKRTPEVPGLGLAQADDSKGEVTLRNDQQTCAVVAMFATDASVKEDALFEFRVRDYSEPTPLMHCD